MSVWAPEILPCPPAERVAALGVLYRRVPPALRPRLIADALAEAERGVIDLGGLWVARRRGRVIGAMLTQPLAGRAAAVWAPEVDPSWWRGGTAVALVTAALADLKGRGFQLAQALLDDSAPRRAAADLTEGGMPRVTELVYLERRTPPPLPLRPGLPVLEWVGFSPETESDFRAVVEQTYHESLDMPELEGLRSLDDVLTSHRARGPVCRRPLAAGPGPGASPAPPRVSCSSPKFLDRRRLGGRLFRTHARCPRPWSGPCRAGARPEPRRPEGPPPGVGR